MKYLLFLICEIQVRKRKKSKHETCHVAIPSFKLPKRKPKLHNFHNRKKEISILQGRQLLLNFKFERNVPLSMKC